MAIVIFDCFRGHKGDEMESILSKNNILAVIVPSNCTASRSLSVMCMRNLNMRMHILINVRDK